MQNDLFARTFECVYLRLNGSDESLFARRMRSFCPHSDTFFCQNNLVKLNKKKPQLLHLRLLKDLFLQTLVVLNLLIAGHCSPTSTRPLLAGHWSLPHRHLISSSPSPLDIFFINFFLFDFFSVTTWFMLNRFIFNSCLIYPWSITLHSHSISYLFLFVLLVWFDFFFLFTF